MSGNRRYATKMTVTATTALRSLKNSSRRQTFAMPGGETEYVRQSTAHETYRSQTPAAEKPLNDREKKRKELEEQLWKTVTEEVMKDLVIKAENNDFAQNNQFETTYYSTFQVNGFKPKEIGEQLDEKLCAKYPLYNTNNGISVPINRYEYEKAKHPVHKPLANLFKKDSRFTSRMGDPNDYHAPVAPGHFAFV